MSAQLTELEAFKTSAQAELKASALAVRDLELQLNQRARALELAQSDLTAAKVGGRHSGSVCTCRLQGYLLVVQRSQQLEGLW